MRTVISISRRFAGSTVDQDIVFYRDLPRIDFVNHADWQNHHLLLRVNFPVDINASKASYEIQFGNVERETTRNHSWDTAKFEVWLPQVGRSLRKRPGSKPAQRLQIRTQHQGR